MRRRITRDEAYAELQRIKTLSGDDEAARSAEDTLRERVLYTIAVGAFDTRDDARGLARVALKTGELNFERRSA
jgi:hypothetical protein